MTCRDLSRPAYPSRPDLRDPSTTFLSETTPEQEERLLKPSQAAAVFGVDPKTMTRWAKAGKIRSVRTIGGHRRYDAAELRALTDRPE